MMDGTVALLHDPVSSLEVNSCAPTSDGESTLAGIKVHANGRGSCIYCSNRITRGDGMGSISVFAIQFNLITIRMSLHGLS
jgi:hypothetical protein